MNRVTALQSGGEGELADRLALTTRDRRLESQVLLGMMRGSDEARSSEPGAPGAAPHGGPDDSRTSEGRTYAHAMSIASFLSAEFGLETLDEKIFVSELAVELAQRIAEDIGGPSASSPGVAPA
jgi:hypothetical protein